MRATHPVESILGTRGKILVLRVLNGVQVPLSAAQVARHTGLTRPAAAAALDALETVGVVASTLTGRSRAYWLQRESAYVDRIVAPALLAEETMGDAMERDLREAFGSLSVSVVVFGSYARQVQDASSDVDVVLVAADPQAKRDLEEATYRESGRFHRRWGAVLSPLVYDLAYAGRLHVTSPGLYAEIERDGAVVSGLSPWEWRIDASK